MAPSHQRGVSEGSSKSSQDFKKPATTFTVRRLRRRKQRSASWSAWDTPKTSRNPLSLRFRSFRDTREEEGQRSDRNKRKNKKSVTFEDVIDIENENKHQCDVDSDSQTLNTYERVQGSQGQPRTPAHERSDLTASRTPNAVPSNYDRGKTNKSNNLSSYLPVSSRKAPVSQGNLLKHPEVDPSTHGTKQSLLNTPMRAVHSNNAQNHNFDQKASSGSSRHYMHTVSKDDYLLARGANPRTGVVTPSVHSDSSAIDEIEGPASQSAGASKWRLKDNQWISLGLGDPSPATTPPERLSPEPPPVPLKYGPMYGPGKKADKIPIRELQDRFVVNMPSAKEPSPPTMSARQIRDYQNGVERVRREGRVMVDADSLPMPGSFQSEKIVTPPRMTPNASPSPPNSARIRRKAVGSPPAKKESGDHSRKASQETVVTRRDQDDSRSTSGPASRRYFSPDDVGTAFPKSSELSTTKQGTTQNREARHPFLVMREGDWIEDIRGSILRKDKKLAPTMNCTRSQSPLYPKTRAAGRTPSAMLPTPMTTCTIENLQDKQHPGERARPHGVQQPSLISKPLPQQPAPGLPCTRSTRPANPPHHNTFPHKRQEPVPLGPKTMGPRTQEKRRFYQQPLQDLFMNAPPNTIHTSIPTPTTTMDLRNRKTTEQGVSVGRPALGQRLDGTTSVPKVYPLQVRKMNSEVPKAHHQHTTTIMNAKLQQGITDADQRGLARDAVDSTTQVTKLHNSSQIFSEEGQRNMPGSTRTPVNTIETAHEKNHVGQDPKASGGSGADWVRDAEADTWSSENDDKTIGSVDKEPQNGTENTSIAGAKTFIARAMRNSLRFRRVRVRTREIEGEGFDIGELPKSSDDSDRDIEEISPITWIPLQHPKRRLVSEGNVSNRSVSGGIWLTNPTGVTALDALLELFGRVMSWARRYKLIFHAKVIGQRLLQMLVFVLGTVAKVYEVTVYRPTTKKGGGRGTSKPLPALPGDEVLGLVRDCMRAGVYALMLGAVLLAAGRVVRMILEAGQWVLFLAKGIGWLIKKILL